MQSAENCRLLGDTWYVQSAALKCVSVDMLLQARTPSLIQRIGRRSGIWRSLCAEILSREFTCVIFAQRTPGVTIALLWEAIFFRRRRRVILLEFMPAPLYPFGLRRIRQRFERWLLGWCSRRCVRAAHVLTEREQEHYSAEFGIDRDQLVVVPWPLKRKSDPVPDFDRSQTRRVISSGRMHCDWDTLLRAADGQDWDLTIICASHDAKAIRDECNRLHVKLLTDVSQDVHQQMLTEANAYVICLHERFISAGQIRVMNAVRVGVPIVAARVIGLQGYLSEDKTALLYEPGDYIGCREAVNRVLNDSTLGRTLAMQAFASAEHRTFEEYLERIKTFVHQQAGVE